MTDAQKWQLIKSIFEEVVDLPSDQQGERLVALCGDDVALRAQVEALIVADRSEAALLDQTPAQLAGELFEQEILPTPDTIGPYRVDHLIGRGGMGTVYKVFKQEAPDSPLAVKVLHRDTYNSSLVQRFKIEWQILSSLSHPNIAKLDSSVGVDDGRPYFAMELIDGQPITAYCNDKKLAIPERLSLFLKVCSATQHAHENHIIHRDIKPANILVNQAGAPKLLDFGIAKVLNPDFLDATTLITQTGNQVLTISYASPEQLRGEPLSTSSDVYSLGVLLYEMLTGQRPHNVAGLSRLEAQQLICDTEPAVMSQRVLPGQPSDATQTPSVAALRSTTPAQLSAQLAGDLDIICQKALHKDVTRRYVSVAALEQDIRRHLNHEPIRARPDDVLYKTRKFAQRHKNSLTLGVAAASFMITLGLFSFQFNADNASQAAAAIDTAPKTLLALPFLHEGTDQQDFFAEGVADEITSYLSNINGLRTIGRNSASKYAADSQATEALDEVFNADYILKGTIEFDNVDDPGGRVRVMPTLVHTHDNQVIWSDVFDEPASDIFDMQSIIAHKVAEALNLKLLESDQLGLAKHLTDNLEAYTYFLRGNEFFKNSEDANSLSFAETMYQQATRKDTTFSKAYAELSKVHAATWFHRIDRSEDRCMDAQKAAEKALFFDPQEAESYVALGMHAYRCRNNLTMASDFFEQALRINPNTIDALQGKAFVLRRQGKLEEALTFFQRMSTLDPLGADYSAIALTYQLLRQYPQADSSYRFSVKYFPEEAHINAIYARMYLAWKTPDDARRALDEGSGTTDNDFTRITSIIIDLASGNFAGTLNRIDAIGKEILDTQVYYIPSAHLRARALRGLGKAQEARQQEAIAQELLEAYLAANPADSRAHATLGRVYAGLGETDKAIASGLRSLELMPIQKDAIQGPLRLEDMAAIYTMIGAHAEALAQLDRLLSYPGFVSVRLIATDPFWQPLRNLPAYQALLSKYQPAAQG